MFVNEKKKMSKNNKHNKVYVTDYFLFSATFLPKTVEVDKRCVVPQGMQTLSYMRR